MSDTKTLKQLGSKKTEYPKKPDIKILETFENKQQYRVYLIPFKCNEFTSLCPITKQPDFARLEIVYVPDNLCIESKSLKLYLFSFRNQGEFHEDVINRIQRDLFRVLSPLYLRVIGDFNVRGGISIKPIVIHYASKLKESIGPRSVVKGIQELVASWDRVKSNLND